MLPVEGSNASLSGYPDVAARTRRGTPTRAIPASPTPWSTGSARWSTGSAPARCPASAAHPQLKNIVLVGADDIVPMARLADTTRAGQRDAVRRHLRRRHASTTARCASSHFLSDDPYGDRDPVPWMDRRLYVPDVAIGRLVETPAEITTMVDQYLASNGHLDTSRAFVSGYDFMIPGANKVSAAS